MSAMTQAETALHQQLTQAQQELAATMRVLDASSTMLAEAQQEIERLNAVVQRYECGVTNMKAGTKEGA